MAEVWLNHFCGNFFEVQSAGLEAGMLNPLVVEVMLLKVVLPAIVAIWLALSKVTVPEE